MKIIHTLIKMASIEIENGVSSTLPNGGWEGASFEEGMFYFNFLNLYRVSLAELIRTNWA